MSVSVIDSREYVAKYQDDGFQGYEQMFDEYGEAVIVDWHEDMTLKTPVRNMNGELYGVNNQKIDSKIEPGMVQE